MMGPFGAYAVVRDEINPRSVKIGLGHDHQGGPGNHFDFGQGQWITPASPDVAPPESAWLRLDPEEVRALYEALAEHFGHTGHDTRALRKDYDAERARVDKLINHAIGAPR